MQPPPADDPVTGSVRIDYFAPPRQYRGRWTAGADSVDVRFSYDPITGAAQAWLDWSLGVHLWWGWFDPVTIPLPPLLLYDEWNFQTPGQLWIARLQITG